MSHHQYVQYVEHTSSRQFWKGKIPVTEILDLVRMRQVYHQSKVDKWSAALAKAREEFPEKGIDFESLVNSNTAQSSYREPTINYDFQQRVRAISARLKYHREKLNEYDNYYVLVADIREREHDTFLLDVQADDIDWLYLPSQVRQEQDDIVEE